MTYVLEALVADADLLDVLSQDLVASRLAPLAQGLALIPMTRALAHALDDGRDARPLGFWQLPSGFDRVLSDRSQDGPIAYVEAECFGGTGEQRSAVWDAGALALGPLHLPEYQPSPPTAARSRRHCGASARRRGTPSTSSWRWAVR
ncbi:hypothetical protein [Actinacidiphila soli]|uniref:hypothetical protein n=1 Tax=Actinacidiphila soli TaxID=2487275 RepID=UPI000FC9B59F|nr:hypothetical protein [Actinacidiphila soli]